MTIGIIGAGNIGGTLATLLAAAGHEVLLSNSRGPESLADRAGGPGGRIRVGTVAEAAAAGDLVVEAIPFGRYRDLPADVLAGRIVVSASNYYPGRDGELDLAGRADTELVAAHLAGSRVVKAFNTIWSGHLAAQGDPARSHDERRAIPVAGDDPAARRTVLDLVDALGLGGVDNGGLHEGGLRQMPGTPVYNADITADEARRLLGG
ncbi:MAG: NADPH-dependent F420 reductase [Kineosporiaceae bacterium]